MTMAVVEGVHELCLEVARVFLETNIEAELIRIKSLPNPPLKLIIKSVRRT